MPVVGLSFNKIVVEKLGPAKGKVQVNNNVVLKDAEKTDLGAAGNSKQGAVKFHFSFTAKYEPKIADMLINGTLTYLDTPEAATKMVEQWKKEKKVPNDVMQQVLNTVFSRCNVEALILSREVALPPPIPLPKIQLH